MIILLPQARSNFPSETTLVEDFVSILNVAAPSNLPSSNAPARYRLVRDNNRRVAKTTVRRYLNGIRRFARANSLEMAQDKLEPDHGGKGCADEEPVVRA
nr:hypothetical protein [Mesorhizobium loti]